MSYYDIKIKSTYGILNIGIVYCKYNVDEEIDYDIFEKWMSKFDYYLSTCLYKSNHLTI